MTQPQMAKVEQGVNKRGGSKPKKQSWPKSKGRVNTQKGTKQRRVTQKGRHKEPNLDHYAREPRSRVQQLKKNPARTDVSSKVTACLRQALVQTCLTHRCLDNISFPFAQDLVHTQLATNKRKMCLSSFGGTLFVASPILRQPQILSGHSPNQRDAACMRSNAGGAGEVSKTGHSTTMFGKFPVKKPVPGMQVK